MGRRPGKAPDGTAGRKSRPLPALCQSEHHFSLKNPAPDAVVPPPRRPPDGVSDRKRQDGGEGAEGQGRRGAAGGGGLLSGDTLGAVRQGAAPAPQPELPAADRPDPPLCPSAGRRTLAPGAHRADGPDSFRRRPAGFPAACGSLPGAAGTEVRPPGPVNVCGWLQTLPTARTSPHGDTQSCYFRPRWAPPKRPVGISRGLVGERVEKGVYGQEPHSAIDLFIHSRAGHGGQPSPGTEHLVKGLFLP